MYAAALEAWQPTHPPKLAPVLEKQLHHPHNFCPKTRNIIFSKTKENPKQTFLLHMYNVFNLKISKEKVENDLAAHTFGHICFVWGQRGDVVASDEIFSFRNSFHTNSIIFFTKKKDSNLLFIFNMICLETHSRICVEKCRQCQLPTSLFTFSTKLTEHKFSISNSKLKYLEDICWFNVLHVCWILGQMWVKCLCAERTANCQL